MGVADGGEARESATNLLLDIIFFGATFVVLGIGITGLVLDSRHKEEIKSIEAGMEALKSEYVLRNRNVIGGDANDLFYETPLGRAYLAVDGEPVGEYFAR